MRPWWPWGPSPAPPPSSSPKFEPATGTEMAIEVRWKDKDGKVKIARAQQWIRNIQTKKVWTRTGCSPAACSASTPRPAQDFYAADSGDFISVLNLPTATLDLPIPSASALEDRTYEGFVEHMPPARTPITIVLIPKPDKAAEKKAEKNTVAKSL